MRVKLTQKIEGNISVAQIERYMKAKNWKLEEGKYRSPDGKYGLSLINGEQLLLNALETIENRCSNAIYLDILELDRNR